MSTLRKAEAELDERRREVVEQMLKIRAVCRGKISEQFLRVYHKGRKEPVLRGPYHVLSWWENGRTKSRRVKKHELEQTREELANYQRFKALCQEFEKLTRALGELERDEGAAKERLKKGLKSPSSRAKKSRG